MLKHTAVHSAFIGLLCTLFLAVAAVADAPKQQINIPPGDLSTALSALAKQSGTDLVYRPEQVKGLKTQGVSGNLSVDDALTKLLAGTPLTVNRDSTGAVLISNPKPHATPAPSAPPTGSVAAANPDVRVAQAVQGSVGPQVTSDEKSDEKRKDEGLTEIIVTGTHIHDVAPITPVMTITHDDIVRQGYTTVAEIIEQLPQNFSGGVSPASNSFSNFGGSLATNNQTFASGINLRGLGPNATLVLLNGTRMAPASIAGFPDISNIPVNIIDRIEILTDGASSVYGADAVAGVVNIITKKEFSGVQVDAGLTGISKGKTPDHNASLLTGLSWNGGGFVASADYEKDNPLYARNRYFAANLPDPWELTPENEKMNIYLSGHQDLSDALTLRSDGFVTRRNFSASANEFANYGLPGLVTQTGRAEQYSAALELDYRISPDWTAALIGQMSKEHDRIFNYSPSLAALEPFAAAAEYNPSFYRVSSLESRVDGKLFEMPGGAVRAAIGAQYLKENFEQVDSQGTLSDPTAGGVYEEFFGSRHVTSAYGELSIPLIGKQNGVPLARGLRVDVSGRYDDYSAYGHTSNPRFALEWDPAADLKVHASYSRSFQVPTFEEQSYPRSALVVPMLDPNSASGSTLTVLTLGGNSNLQPETAKSLNFGLTYEPDALTGLKVAASYFSVKFDNQIIQPNDLGFNYNALQEEALLGPGIVQRNPSLAQITQALNVPTVYNYAGGNFMPGPYVPSDIKAIVAGGYVNSASSSLAGEDVDVRYKIPETRVGDFLVDLDATYFNKYDFKIASTAPDSSYLNTTLNPLRFRAKANFGWSQSAWGANARVNFSNKYDNTFGTQCGPVSCSVSSWTTVDVNAFYAPLTGIGPRWLEDGRVTLIVANIFNRAPPSVTFPSSSVYPSYGYDALNANPLLRTFGVTFTKRFGGNKAQ